MGIITMASLTAPIKWAQRTDKLFIENEKLIFSGVSDKKTYVSEVNLFKEVNIEESKYDVSGPGVKILLVKKEKEEEYWARLTKEKTKFNNIVIDWDKYVD